MKIELVVVWCVICLLTKTGWSQSNNETSRRLRIAVPVREFSKFVVIEPDPVTGENNYSGFAIEVFNAVMSALPSSVSYDFVAFAKPDGTMNGTFDDMLKAVDSKDYDGAVGDISILFYRTDYVDFTMPYMESSITMLVPIKQKPTSGRAGQPSLVEITNTSVLATFIISTLVAAMYIIGINSEGNRERDPRLKSRMHMALLIISLATLFITLLASYISSEATSLALYQGRNGSVKNLNQLIRMGSNVGYREGSFIYRLLILKGIPESKLISLKSEDEMLEMLSKGTSKGGVDAIVANAPHLKLLQSKHCDVFTTVPTTNLQATGFGFVHIFSQFWLLER
ncbi:hypothetical protein RND81_01G109900 [Saponaria officinalis]|uniref:Ionotropic glutamate receptor C-terminal domain-containing protein n=1 Tax=Saponaria officinalis TaxID=3572 RepID=A0AAW1N9E3_SAPOF